VALDGRFVRWLEQFQRGIDFVPARIGVNHRRNLRNDRTRLGRCNRRELRDLIAKDVKG
jgi:hypothetical protein